MKKILSVLFLIIFTFAFIACETPHEHNFVNGSCECGEKHDCEYVDGKCECGALEPHTHAYGEWVVVKEATETEEGLKEKTCSCGDKQTETIAKLEHVHNFVEGKCECGETTEVLVESLEVSGKAEMVEGEEQTLNVVIIPSYATNKELDWSSSDNEVATVENGLVKALKAGDVVIKAAAKDGSNLIFDYAITVKPLVINPESISLTKSEYELIVGDKVQVLYAVLPTEANQEVVITSLNEEIVKIEDEKIVAVAGGNTTVEISCVSNPDIKSSISVKVSLPKATRIDIKDNVLLYNQNLGDKVQLEWTVVPSTASQEVTFTSSDESVAKVDEKGLVEVIGSGSSIITINTTDGSGVTKEVKFMIADTIAPEFVLDENVKEEVTINWNKPFNALEGIKAIDDCDGDITNKIEVDNTVDTKTRGVYKVNYTVKDKAGNVAKMTRTVNVVWNYDVEFIGHAGSYYGLMNSEEAILYAIQVLKYTAVEVDLKQTKDGVFILSHDDTFNGIDLASTNWEDLKDVTRTAGRSGGIPSQNGSVTKDSYTTKLCTLERYLEICKQYDVKAVIELKWSNGINNNDTSRMDDLMKVIEKCEMRENTIFLASQYNCLIWTRNNGYSDIECQYLVNSCESDTYLERCKQYDFTISINVTGTATNSDEWLAKYQEAGIKISTYTYTQYVDYDVVQKWIDKGVNYVTCDWHIMSKLNLPESSNDPSANQTFNVTFKDFDGKVLKEAVVKKGRTAAPPTDPTRLGYDFMGWDKDIRNVTEDMEVTATYQIINYAINYESNIGVTSVSEWASKEEFAKELYNDLFDWFVKNESKINELTKSGDKYTLTKNGKTVSFSSGADIFASDIYTFELTFSNYFYKPVVRANDGSCVIEPSEDYFLNSDAYREKYKEVDALLYRGIVNRYTSYNSTYTPTSVGKIQIFFRFHQWVTGGATINEFLPLPKKYTVDTSGVEVTLPTTKLSYTINDEFDLPAATSSMEFLGWFLDKEFTKPITKIEKGTTGNLILYAKWKTE